MKDLDFETPNHEVFVVVEKLVEDSLTFFLRNTIPHGESLLDLTYSFADTNVGSGTLGGFELVLDVLGSRQVVGVHMSLEDLLDAVPLFLDQGEETISGSK